MFFVVLPSLLIPLLPQFPQASIYIHMYVNLATTYLLYSHCCNFLILSYFFEAQQPAASSLRLAHTHFTACVHAYVCIYLCTLFCYNSAHNFLEISQFLRLHLWSFFNCTQPQRKYCRWAYFCWELIFVQRKYFQALVERSLSLITYTYICTYSYTNIWY